MTLDALAAQEVAEAQAREALARCVVHVHACVGMGSARELVLPSFSFVSTAPMDQSQAQVPKFQTATRDAPKGPRRYAQLEADGEEDDAQLVEEAAYHDRGWDDWKDQHPRGMGNKAEKRI